METKEAQNFCSIIFTKTEYAASHQLVFTEKI